VVAEGFQHGAAGLLSKAGHPVVFTAVLTARLKVHGVGGIHRWIFIKVVVRPQQDPASVAHGNRVGDILSVRDVEEASSHPGYQVLEGTIRPRFSSSSTQLKNIFTRTYIITLDVFTNLVFNVLVVLDELAEVDGRTPHVVLIVRTAAGGLGVLVLSDSDLVPGGGRRTRFDKNH